MTVKILTSHGLAFLIAVVCTNSALAQKDTFDREALKIRDSVVLKSGATLYGNVKKEGVDDDGRKLVWFETRDGGLLKLDLARTVHRSKVRKIDDIDRDYNQHISTLADDAESHRQLYEWCDKQPSGTVRFKDQMRFHLERIMHLDPNDDNAKRDLGYEYIRSQDRWVPKERYYQSLGYERKGTSWAPVKQRNVDMRHESMDSELGDFKGAYRVWLKEAGKPNPNVPALRAELFRICDARSVPVIDKAMKKEKRPGVRSLYVEAFGRVPHQVALNALCVAAVTDEVLDIRERALALLAQDHFNQQSAVATLSFFLKSDSGSVANPNPFVNRAAFGIGELGDEKAVLRLVGALRTTHMVKPGGQAGRIQTGVGTDGNVNGLNLGGDEKPVMRTFDNPAVVNALRKISGEDFGINAPGWQNWYVKNHTHHDIRVRR